jgi:SET domain-containing protein
MTGIHSAPCLVLAPSTIAGRGVFATKPFAREELIEVCPVIVISADQRPDLDKTALYDHYYGWGDDAALAQGLGSFYNHSFRPNAVYDKDIANGNVVIRAIHDIFAGEEITVNYNGDPTSLEPLWFDAQ